MSENTILQNEENVTIATFNITEANIINSNNTITLENLTGMTEIDWGDPNDSATGLSHTYTVAGEYICKIYGTVSIGDYAFSGCKSLTSVVIGDSVTSIGRNAFSNCSSLINVVIPDAVTIIGRQAFLNCSSLINVVIPDAVTNIQNLTFSGCLSLISLIIPNSVTFIATGAFSDCKSLTSVIIGEGVIGISSFAFRQCEKLKSVTFKNQNPLTTDTLIEANINDSTPTYYVPTNAVETYQTTWEGVVDPSKILPDPEERLINLEGLRIYHNTLKEKYLNNKLDKAGGLISGDLSVQGNLNVAGTTTTKDTETILIKDNIIVANSDGNELIEEAGFAVKTGADTAYGIMYDPDGDGVKIGLGAFDENGKFQYGVKEDETSEAQFLATRDNVIENNHTVVWDNEKKTLIDSGVDHSDYAKKTDLSNEEYLAHTKYNVPYNIGIPGLFMYDGAYAGGLFKSSGGGDGEGRFRIAKASNSEIDSRTSNNYFGTDVVGYHCKPIVPANLDYAFKSALTNPKTIKDENGKEIPWTDNDKVAACETIGAVPKSYVDGLVGNINTVLEAILGV